MAELFRQDAEGILSLDDRKRMEDRYSPHGSGQLKLMRDEPEITLRDYCRMMITISDNMATDLLMEAVGIPNINTFLDRLGCPNTRTSVTMGRYHYRMTYQDDLPTNRANDVLQAEASAAGANDYKSVSYSDSLENNVAAPGEMRKHHEADVRRYPRWSRSVVGDAGDDEERSRASHDPPGPACAKSSSRRRAAQADGSKATWA